MIATVRCAAVLAVIAGPALAQPYEGRPNPAYPDGTGNDQIDRLNSAQLNENYRGPYYYRGGPPAPPPPPPPGYDAPPAAGYAPPPGAAYPPPGGYAAPPPPGQGY